MNDPKSSLRIQLRKEYACLNDDYKTPTDKAITSLVRSFSPYLSCDRVFLFASSISEVNTYDLLQDSLTMGKTVLLPKCYGKGIMEFYEYDGSFVSGRYGIQEPTGTVAFTPSCNDIMIVPGLAFSANGTRLGQGGGYYDRYLEKHPCITVGLCRNRFLKEELPIEWNDLPVDYVITETTIYKCKNGASEEAPL